MLAQPVNVRLMLRTYGKQLTSASRLARFKRALALSGAQDMVSISREARRKELVERIAQEIAADGSAPAGAQQTEQEIFRRAIVALS